MRWLGGVLLLVSLLLTGCESIPSDNGARSSPSPAVQVPDPPSTTSEADRNKMIGATVTRSMQEKFDTDDHFKPYHLTAGDVTVVQSQGNDYKGQATVKTPDGKDHLVAIDVTYDGTTVLWQSPPGAFLWLADEPTQADG